MTERQFEKLALGDEIMNKRSPGIILKVTNRFIGPEGLQIEVTTSGPRSTSRPTLRLNWSSDETALLPELVESTRGRDRQRRLRTTFRSAQGRDGVRRMALRVVRRITRGARSD